MMRLQQHHLSVMKISLCFAFFLFVGLSVFCFSSHLLLALARHHSSF
jgi:hypothetical protein